MIKYVLISRFSDSLIFCEAQDTDFNEQFEELKGKVKQYHRQSTSKSSPDDTTLKQIQNSGYGVFYRVHSHIIFTVIVENGYPNKLTNSFIQSIAGMFINEAKCSLGSANLSSRLEAIDSNHYFVKFDRTIKQKKKEYDDPSSMRNVQRLKKELEGIHGIMKENMEMLDKRHEDLLRSQDKAHRINQQAKSFEKNSKKLVWQLWLKKNLVWFVLALFVALIYFFF